MNSAGAARPGHREHVTTHHLIIATILTRHVDLHVGGAQLVAGGAPVHPEVLPLTQTQPQSVSVPLLGAVICLQGRAVLGPDDLTNKCEFTAHTE